MATSGVPTADRAMVSALIRWFDVHERPLPWRGSDPWGVLVSEFMLQQTPVDRVLPVWEAWIERWPTPESLAESTIADALRAWGRLGYPRRARRLHETAVAITDRFDGQVPSDEGSLRTLPGVGGYTAAAVMAFAFGRRSVVLDTNVRRVVARAVHGVEVPGGHISRAEQERAELLWPRTHARSARWSAAVMEFGALVCTARSPACATCPIRRSCAWLLAGQPAADSPARRQPQYEGSDRQVRGRLMAVLRDSPDPVGEGALARACPDDAQRTRVLADLVADGLVVRLPRRRFALPE